ncbi:MAG: ribbon-helix-helix domain-containing protein [Bryobacteraceae bacterium]
MASVERVTVTLPNDLVRDIDRREKNRSKFVAEAVRHELDHRRRPEEDAETLVDTSAGKPVRWVPGEGWVEGRE